uniref:TBCC domain-containing protein 1 n=1 Tax=Anas platyrhynchos platyrhynchos TaxID=8840 RepID=A0A493T242_ANAPP
MPTHVPEEMADFDLEQLASSSHTIYLVCYAIGYYLHAAPLSRNRTPYVYGTNNYKTPSSGQPGSLSAHLFSLGPAPEIQHRTRGGRVSPEPHRGGFTSPSSAAGGVGPISTPARSLPGTGPHLVGGSQVLELLLGPGVVGVPVGVQLQRQLALSVDTLQFLLFLYLQQLSRLSLRTAIRGEQWPSPAAPGPAGKGAGQSKKRLIIAEGLEQMQRFSSRAANWNDQDHLAFVLAHLSDMLELLLEPEQLSASSHATSNSLVSYEAVCALSFLIEGTVEGSGTVHPLHELALWQPCQEKNGYSKSNNAFSFPKLESWLRSCLTTNPFGMTACLRSGKKLAWAQQVEGTTRRAKIACNTPVVPEVFPMVIMSQVYKQTLAKSSDTLVGAHVRIHRCNESFIYLLSPLRSVTIEKCRNSTFVLGPVEVSVHVHSCDNVKVIAVCYSLSLSSTTGCTFHVLTPTQPLILAGNQAVSLAPFHTHYPMLEDHMAQVGLATLPNYWDSPMLLGKESSDTSVFRLLPPSDFYTFVIPFEMEGDTTETPGGLPHAYQKALSQREQKVQIWQKMVKEACLSNAAC